MGIFSTGPLHIIKPVREAKTGDPNKAQTEMGKGGVTSEEVVSGSEVGDGNLAAWLLGVKDIQLQPYLLPSLGNNISSSFPQSLQICYQFSYIPILYESLVYNFLSHNAVMVSMILLLNFCDVLGPHDVRVRIKAVGICGSDVHHFKVDSHP